MLSHSVNVAAILSHSKACDEPLLQSGHLKYVCGDSFLCYSDHSEHCQGMNSLSLAPITAGNPSGCISD